MSGSRSRHPEDWPAGLTLAGLFAVLYLSFPSKAYVFEGLARAMPIETGRFSQLFNGNHLLYGLLGFFFHRVVLLLGLLWLSVLSLQMFDCLLGAVGLLVFFLTLRQLGADRGEAAAWSGVLGLTIGYWAWSTEAENYIFSSLLLSLHWLALLRYRAGHGPSPRMLGLLGGLAVMGHIVNGLSWLLGLWMIGSRERGRPRLAKLQYLAAAAAFVLLMYAAVILFFIKPGSPTQLFHWLTGSASSETSGFHWHGGYSLGGLGQWLKMTLNIFVSSGPEFVVRPAGVAAQAFLWLARGLLTAAAFSAFFGLRSLDGPSRAAAAGCLIWLGCYAAVFISWEPYTMVYRVSDLIPLVTLIYLGTARAWARPWPALIGLGLALPLAAANLTAEIYPRSLAQNNQRLARMEFYKSVVPPEGWIAVGEEAGGGDELYIPFFAERRPILLSRYRAHPQALAGLLDRLLEAQQPVYLPSRVLTDTYWKEQLAPFQPAPAERRGSEELYRLAGPRIIR